MRLARDLADGTLNLHQTASVASVERAEVRVGGRLRFAAATALRCSTRGRIAELAAFAALTALKQPR